jgi:hypothetical protein
VRRPSAKVEAEKLLSARVLEIGARKMNQLSDLEKHVNDLIVCGKPLEAFERFYHDDVVVHERFYHENFPTVVRLKALVHSWLHSSRARGRSVAG